MNKRGKYEYSQIYTAWTVLTVCWGVFWKHQCIPSVNLFNIQPRSQSFPIFKQIRLSKANQWWQREAWLLWNWYLKNSAWHTKTKRSSSTEVKEVTFFLFQCFSSFSSATSCFSSLFFHVFKCVEDFPFVCHFQSASYLLRTHLLLMAANGSGVEVWHRWHIGRVTMVSAWREMMAFSITGKGAEVWAVKICKWLEPFRSQGS